MNLCLNVRFSPINVFNDIPDLAGLSFLWYAIDGNQLHMEEPFMGTYLVSPAQMLFLGEQIIGVFQAVLNHDTEPTEKRAQKKPEPLEQVHINHNGMDHYFAGLLQLGNDTIQ